MYLPSLDKYRKNEDAANEAIGDSFLWLVFYLVLGLLGFAAQAVTTSGYVLEAPESPIAV